MVQGSGSSGLCVILRVSAVPAWLAGWSVCTGGSRAVFCERKRPSFHFCCSLWWCERCVRAGAGLLGVGVLEHCCWEALLLSLCLPSQVGLLRDSQGGLQLSNSSSIDRLQKEVSSERQAFCCHNASEHPGLCICLMDVFFSQSPEIPGMWIPQSSKLRGPLCLMALGLMFRTTVLWVSDTGVLGHRKKVT